MRMEAWGKYIKTMCYARRRRNRMSTMLRTCTLIDASRLRRGLLALLFGSDCLVAGFELDCAAVLVALI